MMHIVQFELEVHIQPLKFKVPSHKFIRELKKSTLRVLRLTIFLMWLFPTGSNLNITALSF